MQVDQRLRRWTNRLRRRIIGAVDHEPVVEIEGPPPTARVEPTPVDWGRRIRRGVRGVASFVVTLALLGGAYLMYMAVDSQVTPDWGPLRTPPTETALASMANEVLAGARAPLSEAPAFLFLPSGRRAREVEYQLGALEAVGDLARALQDERRSTAELAIVAQDWPAVGAPEPSDLAARIGEAEAAWGRHMAQRRATDPQTVTARRFAVLAGMAAAALDDAQGPLLAAAGQGRFGPTPPRIEAAFFRARGRAYGWRLLLERAADELALEPRAAIEAELGLALGALENAAAYQPLFLFNGPADAWLTPNHPAALAERLRLARAALMRLAATAEDAAR